MKARELANLGVPHGKARDAVAKAIGIAAKNGATKKALRESIAAVVADPVGHTSDPVWGALAAAIIQSREARARFEEREAPAPYTQWGTDIDEKSVEQMVNACKLPIAVAGALMPDAHLGYGLPIGGVLATRNAVIPYAVGVDIACRMKMSVLDLPIDLLESKEDKLKVALARETRFGVGAKFKKVKRQHDVMDEDWSFTALTKSLKDKAWAQLGTSGSGNHFVEYGILTVEGPELGIEPGTYLALLSHSGSRGAGATIAQHYSKLARNLHPELPKELVHLAWLDLDTSEGKEYWAAMELMGRYAEANHFCIHKHVAENLGAEVLLDIENHHNFAWKEDHGGESVIVHRKGATPAGKGTIGIIPGSMATPAFIVRGKGNDESLHSAAHGAGRKMSRTQAKKEFNWKDAKKFLDKRNVKLLSAGLDEVPMAYKNIEKVMAAQSDLVEILARFDPRLVKMAEAGERPED